jgi:hypothetical protein
MNLGLGMQTMQTMQAMQAMQAMQTMQTMQTMFKKFSTGDQLSGFFRIKRKKP